MSFMDWPLYQIAPVNWLNNVIRYLLFAGGAYWIFWKWAGNRFAARRLYPFPSDRQVRKEIFRSVRTTMIIVPFALLAIVGAKHGIFKLYWDVGERGMLWYFASFWVVFFCHDTYFYWTHRWMHHPKLFKVFHRSHHDSIQPSPFAAYSFDVGEALVQALFFTLLLLVVPLHFSVPFFFTLFTFTVNVYQHLGIAPLDRAHESGAVLRHFNSPRSHAIHHARYRGNYGFYLNWWDRWMKTRID